MRTQLRGPDGIPVIDQTSTLLIGVRDPREAAAQ
jgi:hypothetical protein